MTAKVIAIINFKGGVGKTMLSMQLGGALALRGNRVFIVDADQQNSAVEWSAQAHQDNPFPAKVANLSAAGVKIHGEIRKYIDDNDYIIVDCPPAIGSNISKSVLVVADLAIVPFIPDSLNLIPTVNIRDVIEGIAIQNEGLKSLLVLNRVEAKTRLTKEVVSLIHNFNMPVAKTNLHKRTCYPATAMDGTTVHSLKSSAKEAIKEIESLTDEIILILNTSEKSKIDEEAEHEV